MTERLERIRIEPMPDRPDQVVVTFPNMTYLDTQAWSVEVGIYAEELPQLAEAVRAVQCPPAGNQPHLQRQPAYDAVYEVIRSLPRDGDHRPSVVERNAAIWRAVQAALDAMGVPAGEGQEQP